MSRRSRRESEKTYAEAKAELAKAQRERDAARELMCRLSDQLAHTRDVLELSSDRLAIPLVIDDDEDSLATSIDEFTRSIAAAKG